MEAVHLEQRPCSFLQLTSTDPKVEILVEWLCFMAGRLYACANTPVSNIAIAALPSTHVLVSRLVQAHCYRCHRTRYASSVKLQYRSDVTLCSMHSFVMLNGQLDILKASQSTMVVCISLHERLCKRMRKAKSL